MLEWGGVKTAVFDTRWILDKPSGIGVYALELARRLPARLPGWRFVFLLRRDAPPELESRLLADAPGGADAVRMARGPLSPLGLVALHALLLRRRADVFHTPNFMPPHLPFPRRGGGRVRVLATIHDVIPLVLPDYAPASRTSKMRGLFRLCLRATARGADALFTVSETSRRDVVSALGLSEKDAARVRAVYNGVDGAFSPAGRPPAKAADDPSARTLLYVGRSDPYKNVPLLVEAFAAARAAAPWPLRLVVAGARDPRYPEAEERARKLGVADAVRFAGPLPHVELADLYRRADLLVHPSRYEGFGLQIAEAFASGLPVLCTDGGAAPETAGGAARVVPLAAGAAGFSRAILETLSDPAALERLAAAGLRRAALFTWDRAADEIAAAYG